jgi:ABC-2 type transport system ATP-binding protein
VSDTTTVIEVNDLSKRFVIRKDKSLKERLVNFQRSRVHKEDFWALRDINLHVESASTVGLIGPNGSGKSTLLKAIGGIIDPTSGSVRSRGRLAALLELGAGFHPDLTGRENVYLNASILGLSRGETDALFDQIVDFSGVEKFIDTQVKFYSSGMYVRLAFSVAVHVDPDILLVDEVLAVGDEPFQRKCLDKIRQFQLEGRTIIMVSHSASNIGDFCTRAVVLDHGNLAFDGTPARALRVLRKQFDDDEDDRKEESGVTGTETIESVRLLDSRGQEVTLIEPGTDLQMEIVVHTESTLRDWVVGMGIETPLGNIIFGTNTRRLDPGEREPFTGSKKIVFTLPNVVLGRGQFLVHASFGVTGNESLVRIPDAVKLECQDGMSNIGTMSIRASFWTD